MYSVPTARIKVNGDLTAPFAIKRGCRQGCAVSPLLFTLFIEPLSQWIHQDENIKGILTAGGNKNWPYSMDDILIFFERPTQSFPKLMRLLEGYGSMSGYKLNVSKTQVLCFNYEPTTEIRAKYKLNWDAKSIKYLGVHLPKDLTSLFNINYGPLNSKLKVDIRRWHLVPFLNLSSRI